MKTATGLCEGVRLYWRGFRQWRATPGLMALGLVPGAITLVLFVLALLSLSLWLDDVSGWFADRVAGTNGFAHAVAALAFGLAVVLAFVLLAVYAFVSITTTVGQPFFEAISRRLDDQLGPVSEVPAMPWWRNASRGLGEGLRLFLATASLSVGLFLVGLIPVAGTLVAWVMGALFGGWFVALEFTSIPFERRGLRLRDRRRLLGAQRSVTVGFGAMAFVMSLLPPVAVLMMPAGIAGGTLLARRALSERY